ncbi:FHA domain-containing protein [Bifidobacterium longum]|uniref:FHA domain-containing protein n=1 Tax=Bifidobacterium longum TaxID=216816 RepID=UPI001C390014|nr:FHA domain-containing protein [Bifidobacterium longum]MBV3463645.1 FHA domain-containing protein [Bifidobacterium longum]MBV3530655.1 FHA domain-containing protein [Bifidobacterium longum]
MAKLPYPPAPELGWYSDDPVEGTPDSAVGTAEPQNDYGQPSSAETAANTAAAEPAAPAATAAAEPAATAPADTTPHAAENDIEDWDGTVLSSSFTSKAAKKTYLLHNDVTGQTIVIDKSTLLGRKPSMDVPQGAKAERIEDPTRTTSRNHAAISVDTDGALWIEDYGSLNGTYIITNGQETQVTKGTTLKLSAPSTVRIGDQFFQFTEKQA